jgi:hypothetical protein
MKTFVISITDRDGYTGECRGTAATKAEAMKAAREYIKVWCLAPAKINYCNEVKEEQGNEN